MKKIILFVMSLGFSFALLVLANNNVNAAKLPSSITHHTWYRITDGSQGGYHDKTTFHGSSLTYHGYPESKFSSSSVSIPKKGSFTWKFSNIKKANSKNYYARINSKYPVRIRLISKKSFWVVPKHTNWKKGNYTGNSQYGAIMFELAH